MGLTGVVLFAGLLVPAHAAFPNPSISAPGVRIWVRLPAQPSEQYMQQVFPNADQLIRQLLGPDVQRSGMESPEDKRVSFYYEAKSWLPGLDAKKRDQLIGILRSFLRDDLRIEDPVPVAQALVAVKKAVDRKTLQEGLAQAVPEALLKGGQSQVYDNSGAVSKDAVAVPAVPGAAPAQGVPRAKGLRSIPVPSPKPSRSRYDSLIEEEAKAAGVDPALVRAVIAAKSGFKTDLASGDSYGLMLVTYGSAKSVGIKDGDLSDPRTNIRAGSRLLARLLKQFGGDTHRALAAYQAGAGVVVKSGGIPQRKDVKDFLAAYEKYYRQGPDKPAVVPVEPPKLPALAALQDKLSDLVRPEPKDPVAQWKPLIDKVCAKHGVDRNLVEAMMRQENPWGNPKKVSDAGAVGLMQLMPATAKALRVDPYDPEQNIDGGVRHLKYLLGLFDNDRVLAVAAYNAGHVIVDRVDRVPNIRETATYVARVFRNYKDLSGEAVDYSPYLTPRARTWVRTYLA